MPAADTVFDHIHVLLVGAVLHAHHFADVGRGRQRMRDGVRIQNAYGVPAFSQFNGSRNAKYTCANNKKVVSLHITFVFEHRVFVFEHFFKR